MMETNTSGLQTRGYSALTRASLRSIWLSPARSILPWLQSASVSSYLLVLHTIRLLCPANATTSSAIVSVRTNVAPIQSASDELPALVHRFETRGVTAGNGSGEQNVRCLRPTQDGWYALDRRYTIAYCYNDQDADAVESILCGPTQFPATDGSPSRREVTARAAFVSVFGEEWYNLGNGIIPDAVYLVNTSDGKIAIEVRPPTDRVTMADATLVASCSVVGLNELRIPADDLRTFVRTDRVYRVTVGKDTFAFKQARRQCSAQESLKEVNAALKARSSPFVLDIHAIVVDQLRDEKTAVFCGFLTKWSTLGTWAEFAWEGQRFDWPTAFQLAYDFVRGVQALHAIGEYNGDLKPSNILLLQPEDGEPHLRAQVFDLDAQGGWTLGFNDPARAEDDEQPSALHDIYSTGCVLAWLLERTDGPMLEQSWLRELAQQCVGPAERRPTINQLVSTFDGHVSAFCRATA